MEASFPSEVNEEAAMLLRTGEIQKIFSKYDTKVKPQKLSQKISTQLSASKFLKKVF